MKNYILVFLLLLFAIAFEYKFINKTRLKSILFSNSCGDYRRSKTPPIMNTLVTNYEHFITYPLIWIYIQDEVSARYWESFYSRKTNQQPSSIIGLTIKSIVNHNKFNANIQIITNENLKIFIRDKLFYKNYKKACSDVQKEYIKYYILYTYGGIWLPADTLVFKNFGPIFDKNKQYDLITFDCPDNNINCDSMKDINPNIICSKKGSEIIKKVLNYIVSLMRTHNNFIFNNNISDILLKENSRYHYGTETCASRDINGSPITVENLISHNYTILPQSDSVFLISLRYKELQKYNKYKWLLRLNNDQIMKSNMWLSKLIRYSFGKSQTVYAEYTDKHDIKIGQKEIMLCPRDQLELSTTILDSNISPYTPYLLVNKEPIRKT